ncbi:MAG: hypothetical protein JSS11_06510 [Verrucomicrobia bacterium]|nr:hypothetical protein [Verrucomicrobiota bacterium]
MKTSYRVTLLRLSADASVIDPLNHLPLELGEVSTDTLRQLLENLAQFDVLALSDEDPVIVIRRGDQGWRVTPGTRCLMFHDGTGTLDPIYPLDPAGILTAIAPGGTIPPFSVPSARGAPAPAPRPCRAAPCWWIFLLVPAVGGALALLIWLLLRKFL